jgi:predicted transport protein
MGEINLYQVVNNGDVTEIEPDPIELEKNVQELIENNLEDFLGIRFLDSEYSTGEKHGGRIDTLGVDENNSPVIIEYKKTKNQNVINQGLYYFDWLVDHTAAFEGLVRDEIEDDIEVDWSSPRLVCIAPDFTKYDSHAVEQIGQNIELMRFERYSDGLLLLELVNAVESANTGQSTRGDYTTVAEKLEKADANLTQLFDEVDELIRSLGDDVQKKELKYYFAYKTIRNFACVEVRPNEGKLLLYLQLNPDEADRDLDIARDVSDIGHYGTGDLELTISDKDDLERCKEHIETSYEGL